MWRIFTGRMLFLSPNQSTASVHSNLSKGRIADLSSFADANGPI